MNSTKQHVNSKSMGNYCSRAKKKKKKKRQKTWTQQNAEGKRSLNRHDQQVNVKYNTSHKKKKGKILVQKIKNFTYRTLE